MKHVAFLLGSAAISGGTNVIFEHSIGLKRVGYQVTIVIETKVQKDDYSWHSNASELTWMTIEDASKVKFDYVIATWWQSVQLLHKLQGNHYIYFVQSIESRFFPKKDERTFIHRDVDIMAQWCENTYRYPLHVITEARWIQKYLLEKYNRPSHLVLNGIRKDIYKTTGPSIAPKKPGRLRILIEGPLNVFYKNVERTIELCQRANVGETWLLTSSKTTGVPGVDRCFSQIPIDKTPEIYRSCDILVKLSYIEGMFGPPLEMFHCGGTSLVYKVTGHDEYILDGENSIALEKDDEDGVVSWLQKLREDETTFTKLVHGAQKTAEQWPNWDDASKQFHSALQRCSQSPPTHNANFLKLQTQSFLETRDNGFKSRQLDRLAEREQNPDKSYLNAVQVYWDEGMGMKQELVAEYHNSFDISGHRNNFLYCEIAVPIKNYPATIRIDPSVRIGIVVLKSLKVTDKETGEILQSFCTETDWKKIFFTGTMALLQRGPNPIIEAYGEDPQMILPQLTSAPGKEGILIRLDLFEFSFRQVLQNPQLLKTNELSYVNKIVNKIKTLISPGTWQ